MPDEEQNVAATDDAGAEEVQESQTAQYATREDLDAVTKALESLQEQLSGQGGDADPMDEAGINRAYADMVGANTTAEGSEEVDPQEQRLERLEKSQNFLVQTALKQENARMHEVYNAKGRAKFDDWDEHEEALWKFAAQPGYDGLKKVEDVYVLWKYHKVGTEGLTAQERGKLAGATKRAEATAREPEEAKAASSEKPGAESSGKERENSSMGELLRETWDKLPDKPVFH